MIGTRARELQPTAPEALATLERSMLRHCVAMRELARAPTAVATTTSAAPAVAVATSAAPRVVPKQSEGFCGGSRRTAVAAADAAATTGEAAPAAGIEVARGAALEIRFESKRCIHARHCVLGAPRVFLANTPGE